MRVTSSLVVCLFLACAPPQATPNTEIDDDVIADPIVALDDDLVAEVISRRCFGPVEAVVAINPGLDQAAWSARLVGGPTALASPHVILDEEAIAACRAALDASDCTLVEERCIPR